MTGPFYERIIRWPVIRIAKASDAERVFMPWRHMSVKAFPQRITTQLSDTVLCCWAIQDICEKLILNSNIVKYRSSTTSNSVPLEILYRVRQYGVISEKLQNDWTIETYVINRCYRTNCPEILIKLKRCHTRKGIWICRPENGGYFVSTSMCYTMLLIGVQVECGHGIIWLIHKTRKINKNCWSLSAMYMAFVVRKKTGWFEFHSLSIMKYCVILDHAYMMSFIFSLLTSPRNYAYKGQFCFHLDDTSKHARPCYGINH